MRLALARRYVEAGDFSSALPHYFYILERGPNAEALMYMGWMAYLSDEPETGAGLLEQSLELDPENLLAQWFLANARYHGLGDRAGAVPLLEAVIASGLAPVDIAAEAQRMIDEAGS
jgi:cytochrome c-type biogenesis protein CcmH/NrfG